MRKEFAYLVIFILFAGLVFVLIFNALIEDWYEAHYLYQESLLLQASKKTTPYLKQQFRNKKIKVLIAPGHDNESSGTQFRNIREADLTSVMGELLFQLFDKDNKFEAFLLRDKKGYKKEFISYFKNEREKIIAFRDKFKGIIQAAFDVGILRRERGVVHNSVYGDISVKLYGINKWANENDIDLVLHLHFNDYPGHKYNQPGKYSGFSIYAPESQLPNSKASLDIAKKVFDKMSKYFAVSDYPPESKGIVEDQELIALGANGSLDTPALLIEHSYIYESPLVDKDLRPLIMREMALQTYAGINQYFNRQVIGEGGYNTFLLPYFWKREMAKGVKNSKDVLALQAALVEEELYPPEGFSISQCPVTGNFLNCTKKAVLSFQKKYRQEILTPLNLVSATGFVGKSTLKKLNQLYSN